MINEDKGYQFLKYFYPISINLEMTEIYTHVYIDKVFWAVTFLQAQCVALTFWLLWIGTSGTITGWKITGYQPVSSPKSKSELLRDCT